MRPKRSDSLIARSSRYFTPNSGSFRTVCTAYAVVVEGAQKRLDIVYWWFFNYNQGKTVAGTSWGNHISDWEHVKVKLDGVDFANPQNERVVGVMYDHHGDQDNFKPGDGNTEFSSAAF